jgi:hypothetical protein
MIHITSAVMQQWQQLIAGFGSIFTRIGLFLVFVTMEKY